mgnify:CR=1 FL=1
MKRGNKRAQFFILAAVIISSVIVTLAASINYARVNKNPDKFYDLSENLKSETGKIIDFGVYQDSINVQQKLVDFSEQASEYVSDKDPNLEFIFIYGNKTNISIENYARADLDAGGVGVGGGGLQVNSNIEIDIGGGFTKPQSQKISDYNQRWRYITNIVPQSADFIKVKFRGEEYNFALSENQQFLMILQKEQINETYVDTR